MGGGARPECFMVNKYMVVALDFLRLAVRLILLFVCCGPGC